ncbi:MAG: anion permease [Lachnospiraceae bacterium]|nr:anion permease [Lachnospiraceae bacterium]
MTFQMVLVLLVFVFICVSISSSKIPTELGCLASITVLWLAGILSTDEAWGNFVGNTVISMIGMIILGGALQKTSLLGMIANALTKMKGGDRVMVAAAMLFPFLMCQFTGSTVALIVCLPLLGKMAETSRVPKARLILPAALGAQLGIGVFPIGMSTVLVLQKNEFLTNLGSSESMKIYDICLSRIPGAVIAMLFVILIGYKLLPKGDDVVIVEDARMESKLTSDLPKWKENAVYVIFVVAMVAMFFNDTLGLTAGQISVVAALAVVILGVMDGKDVTGGLIHSPVVMVACMLSLATALTNSGAADLISTAIGNLIGSANNMTIVVAAFFLICSILTQFMENGGLVNVLTPLAILACMNSGISALPVICALELPSITAIMTPMASGTAAAAFGAGKYSIKDAVKFGLPVVVIEMIVSVIWMPIYFGF